MGKFYLLLHLLIITDHMSVTTIWPTAPKLKDLRRIISPKKEKKGEKPCFHSNTNMPLSSRREEERQIAQRSKILSPQSYKPPQYLYFTLPSPSVRLANNPLVSKLLRQPLGTQIALDQANLFCKGDLFNHLIFFGGHLFIWFPRLQRTLRGYSNKAGESNR